MPNEYLMLKDAFLLKQMAEQARTFNPQAHVVVSATAVISLVNGASKPSLGLATTQELREELAARGPDSPGNYKTLDIEKEVLPYVQPLSGN